MLFRSDDHDIAHIIGYALSNISVDENGDIYKKFNDKMLLALQRYQRLNYEILRIYDAFEEAGIPFIPLKGAVVRSLYPKVWMRTSCDVDVLVHEEDLERAVSLLSQKLGYTTDNKKGVHDISLYSSGGIHLELHYNIIEDNEELDRVLRRVWDYASPIKEGKSQCVLTNEFFLFHIMAHLSYHFLFGGCGIRPFIDLYLIRQKLEIDEEKLMALLGEANLREFYANAVALSEVWMLGKEHTDLTLKIESYVVSGGVYGTRENRTLIQQQKRGGKFRYFIYRVFLPCDKLKYIYPVLQKHPWLAPVMQVRRWFGIVFGGRLSRSVNELKVNSSVSKTEAESIRRFLSDVGLENI